MISCSLKKKKGSLRFPVYFFSHHFYSLSSTPLFLSLLTLPLYSLSLLFSSSLAGGGAWRNDQGNRIGYGKIENRRSSYEKTGPFLSLSFCVSLLLYPCLHLTLCLLCFSFIISHSFLPHPRSHTPQRLLSFLSYCNILYYFPFQARIDSNEDVVVGVNKYR